MNGVLQIEADVVNEKNAALEEVVEVLAAEVEALVAKSEATLLEIHTNIPRGDKTSRAENELIERRQELADIRIRLLHAMGTLRKAEDAAAAAVALEPLRLVNEADLDVDGAFGAFRVMCQNLVSASLVPLVGHYIGRGIHAWALWDNGIGSGIFRLILGIDSTGRSKSSLKMANDASSMTSVPSEVQLWVHDWDPVW